MAEHNKRKSDFLGINFSTASMRLRKMILFQLVQECKKDICFKCGMSILNIDELSIEHKLPWLNRDANLFWDLSNIAFSHLACNVPHLQKGGNKGATKKIGPEGTTWCTYCKLFVNTKLFSKNSDMWNGLQNRCNPCRSDSRKVLHRK